MSDSEFKIEKEVVRGRDRSAVKMIAGLSMSELIILLLGTMFMQAVWGSTMLTLGFALITFSYFRYLKSIIPDNFLANAARFYLRTCHVYRAGGRDYEWRPPVAPD